MSNEVTVIEGESSIASEKLLPQLAPTGQLGTHGEIEARRAAIETLARVQVARAFPRGPLMDSVEAELKAICSDPQFAEKAIYAKPVDKDGKNFIYGPSVFLAEEIARLYPNYEVTPINHGSRGEQTDGEVQIWDMEKNNRFPEKFAVSHWQWDGWKKQAYLETNPQKIRQMFRAELSKVKRQAIFATTPKLLQRKCYEWCEATNKMSAEALLKTAGGALTAFAEQFEVTEAQILKFLKRDDAKKITTADVRLLRAVFAAVKSGEVKASDIWEGAKDPTPVKGQKKETQSDTPSESTSEKEKTEPSSASTTKADKATSSKQPKNSSTSNTQEPAKGGEKSTLTPPAEESESSSNQQSTESSESGKSAETGAESKEPSAKPSPKAVSAEEAAALEEMFK